MPYSWGAETPLSNFEIRLDDATRPRQDPALTVAFTLDPPTRRAGPETRILAWTTTPWTLPSNLALAVGPDIDYVVARTRRRPLRPRRGRARAVRQRSSARPRSSPDEGRRTRRSHLPAVVPVLRRAPPTGSACWPRDFVERRRRHRCRAHRPGLRRGRPARRARATSIELVVPVDDERPVHRRRRRVGRRERVRRQPQDHRPPQGTRASCCATTPTTHNYPHCWRTDTPIIYRAMSSPGTSRSPTFRDRMVELNQQINWIPDHVRDGAVRQVARRRTRLVDQPQPLLGRADPGVAQRRPRLPARSTSTAASTNSKPTSVSRPTDLHRPFIDDLVRPNPDDPTGRSMMRRVPEVLDCWFESGSMPYAQSHYPFENKEWFEQHYPADFIVEYIAQTRGWFYTMHVLSHRAVRSPGVQATSSATACVLDEDGRKLSKRLRNYPDPEVVFETIGSDALRWFLHGVAHPARRRSAHRPRGLRHQRRRAPRPQPHLERVLLLHALRERRRLPRATERTDSEQLLDRYILAKTHELVDAVTGRMDDLRPRRRRAPTSPRSSTRSTTGTSAALGSGSGHRPRGPTRRRRARHPVHRTPHAVQGRSLPCFR